MAKTRVSFPSLLLFCLSTCSCCYGWVVLMPASVSRLVVGIQQPLSTMVLYARRRHQRYNDNDKDDDSASSSLSELSSTPFPQLPPSSLFGKPKSSLTNSSPSKTNTPGNHDDMKWTTRTYNVATHRKLKMQYTCNICNHGNCHKVSRSAYRRGVVIATCQGCQTQHLIADHLHFTNLLQQPANIEDGFSVAAAATSASSQQPQPQQQTVNVLRVSPDVFNLERLLRYDTRGGSLIVDEQGRKSLE